jgi:hypothetical protein
MLDKFEYHFQSFDDVKYQLITSEWSKYIDKGSYEGLNLLK